MASKKMTPAVRHLRYELTTSANINTENSHYIDLARDLSVLNRRLYRQGRAYHVKKITIVSSDTPNIGVVTDPSSGAVFNNAARVSVSTAGDSWVTRGAWKRGFQVWNRMNDEATANLAGDIAGTWADFKVYLSNEMKSATALIPKDNGGNNAIINEWVYSEMVSPDGTTGADTFDLGLLGNHSGAAGSRSYVGLVKSFGESRPTVNLDDPTVPGEASDDPLANVFDYGTTLDEVVDHVEAYNDRPPYDVATYPGDDGNMPKPLVVQDTTLVDGRATMGGFHAICGLLEIEARSPVASDVISVLVELAPGSYRGIKADVI